MAHKRILGLFIFLLVASVTFQSKFVFAATTCGVSVGTYCNVTTEDTFRDVVIVAIKYLFSIIGIFYLLFTVVAGIRYLTSAGNEKNITLAKESLSSSILGLVIALLAYSILDIIHGILNS